MDTGRFIHPIASGLAKNNLTFSRANHPIQRRFEN